MSDRLQEIRARLDGCEYNHAADVEYLLSMLDKRGDELDSRMRRMEARLAMLEARPVATPMYPVYPYGVPAPYTWPTPTYYSTEIARKNGPGRHS